MDQPRDERSLDHQGCRLPTMLVVAAASRDFWIGGLEPMHVDQVAGNETVPPGRAWILKCRQSACRIGGLINLFGCSSKLMQRSPPAKVQQLMKVSTIVSRTPGGLVRLATA